MHYLKLIKLLYLADRSALQQWGVPISNDRYVSMDHGPVLSQTYNLIRDGGRYWSKYISAPMGDYEVKLANSPSEAQKLSPAEERLLDEVFARFGTSSRWDLVDQTHGFPEWKNPYGSSLPISMRAVLEALGESAEEIRAILAELGQEGTLEHLLEIA